jgi:transposase-like protein
MAKIKMTPNATGEVMKMGERRSNGRPVSQATSPTGRATISRMPPNPTPAAAVPDPEVPEKAARRRFTAEYKLRIVREAEGCEAPGDVGALLRREGLYSSHLTTWRRQREGGMLEALMPKKRGRHAPHPLSRRVAELERENAHLQRRLKQAETIIEVPKKSPRSWGSP